MNAFFRVVAIAAVALAIIFGPLNLLPRGVCPGRQREPLADRGNVAERGTSLPRRLAQLEPLLPSGDIATIGGGR